MDRAIEFEIEARFDTSGDANRPQLAKVSGMQDEIEMEVGRIDSTERIAILAPIAAHVQDLFGDLQFTLLRGDDPMCVLSELKEAWRHFRDAALAL